MCWPPPLPLRLTGGRIVLALIGNLICSWSNNESLFIYILMILLRTEEAAAAVVFATLNTTRARLDLIQRLAKIRITDKALAKSLTALIERFSESTKVRNELNHCMFVFDRAGAITHTQSMRLMETRSSLRFGELKALDETRLQEMAQTTSEMTKINRDIWDLLPRLEAHVCGDAPPQRRARRRGLGLAGQRMMPRPFIDFPIAVHSRHSFDSGRKPHRSLDIARYSAGSNACMLLAKVWRHPDVPASRNNASAGSRKNRR